MSTSSSKPRTVRQRRRTKVIRFRATPEEEKRIRDLAAETGLSVTRLLILSALHGQPSAVRRADPALLRHLAAIGNNLNQIARACNYRATAGEPLDQLAVLIELRNIHHQLMAYAADYVANG